MDTSFREKSDRKMPRRQLVVTPNALRFDSRALQPRIQQCPAARPFFSVDDGHILPGEIRSEDAPAPIGRNPERSAIRFPRVAASNPAVPGCPTLFLC